MTAWLSMSGVTFGYREQLVLRGVELRVDPGEILGILGPNGAGKTTLLRLAAGLIAPRSGQVLLHGSPAAAMSPRRRAREVAVVPQGFEPSFGYTALEVVLMGRFPWARGWWGERRDQRIAMEAMERVGIDGLASRPVGELSGGERQLVLLARALAQDTGLLLLDEATAHLDLEHRVGVARIVSEVVGEGKTVVMIMHDLNVASQLCHRVALLHGGVIAAQGPAGEVLSGRAIREVFGVETFEGTLPRGGARFFIPLVER